MPDIFDLGEIKMSIENVKAFFEKEGIAHRVLELGQSSATVELAAAALGTECARIAKTLFFLVNGTPVLIVCAGDVRVDNAKYKSRFGTKAKMLTADELIELVGHAPGGVCPFALKCGTEVYLDNSLQRFKTVFPACGSSNSAIELTVSELEKYSGYLGWVDVTKEIPKN